MPESLPSSAGLAAAASVLVLGIAIVSSGNDGAGDAPPANVGATAAVFEPKKVTIQTTHVRIWEENWPADGRVQLRAKDLDKTLAVATKANARLATGDGRQLAIRLANVRRKQKGVTGLVAELHADRVPGAGEYTGSLSLDPLDEKAAGLEVTVKARHHWVWPLLVLFGGILAGVGGTRLYAVYRRKAVLRIALIEAADRLLRLKPHPEVFELHAPLLGAPIGDLTPRLCSDVKVEAMATVPRLWCRIRRKWSADNLDDIQKDVEEVARRIDVWDRTADGVTLLGAALAGLPEDAPSSVRTQTQQLLDEMKGEPDQADAEAALARLAGQAIVVTAFTHAWKVFASAGRPANLDPTDVYAAALDEPRRTPERSRQLAARLRERELALQAGAGQGAGAAGSAITGPLVQREPFLVTAAGDDPLPRVPSTSTRYHSEARRMRRGIRIGDLCVFAASLVIAALAFLLPIYTATNFGTLDQYIALFAAGFLGKVAVDQSLDPVRSTRLSKAAEKAAVAE